MSDERVVILVFSKNFVTHIASIASVVNDISKFLRRHISLSFISGENNLQPFSCLFFGLTPIYFSLLPFQLLPHLLSLTRELSREFPPPSLAFICSAFHPPFRLQEKVGETAEALLLQILGKWNCIFVGKTTALPPAARWISFGN